jgi:NAD(P)H dehydrogenase (quinone)
MTIAVTGSTGHLGRLIVLSLLDRGVAPGDIVAIGRSAERLADLGETGVAVAVADYTDPASLDAALAGVDTLVLVSSNDFNDRVGQHRSAIDAAGRAGVGHVIYTSGPKADRSTVLLLADHGATEQYLAASGLPATVLRNGWYVENYTGQIATYLQHGMVGAAGDGRVSLAPRSDFAAAAAVVATGDGHAGRTYELAGPAVTLPELAAILSDATGTPIAYTDVPMDAYEQILAGAGMPAPLAHIFADVDRGIAQGELESSPADLESLLGRPATPVPDAVRVALAD